MEVKEIKEILKKAERRQPRMTDFGRDNRRVYQDLQSFRHVDTVNLSGYRSLREVGR